MFSFVKQVTLKFQRYSVQSGLKRSVTRTANTAT